MYVYNYLYIHCKARVSKPSNTSSVAICHTHCNTLQHTTTHCNTLQHTATHCNTLQHTAITIRTLPSVMRGG